LNKYEPPGPDEASAQVSKYTIKGKCVKKLSMKGDVWIVLRQ